MKSLNARKKFFTKSHTAEHGSYLFIVMRILVADAPSFICQILDLDSNCIKLKPGSLIALAQYDLIPASIKSLGCVTCRNRFLLDQISNFVHRLQNSFNISASIKWLGSRWCGWCGRDWRHYWGRRHRWWRDYRGIL